MKGIIFIAQKINTKTIYNINYKVLHYKGVSHMTYIL